MNRILVILLLLVAMLVGAMAWSGGGVEKRADFAFINRGDIYTLDLNTMSYMQDFRLTYGIREGLCNLAGKTIQAIPGGALKWELGEDKKTWTFHLRKESKWSNGDPVTADDYIFSWRRFLTEPGEYTYLFYYIRKAKEFETTYAAGNPINLDDVGMRAVDPHTFQVSLNNPVPYMLEIVAFPPFYPRHEKSMAPFRRFTEEKIIEALASAPEGKTLKIERVRGQIVIHDTEAQIVAALAQFAKRNPFGARPTTLPVVKLKEGDDAFAKLPAAEQLARMVERKFVRYAYDKAYTRPPHVVTNGAFVLKEWDFKKRLWLEKSPMYWDSANVKCNTVEMVVAENPQSQLLLYETGQVDWNSDVSGEHAAELRDKGRKDLRTSPAFGTAFLTLLCKPELPPSLGGGKNPLADVRVRQALAMSIDKRAIVNTVTRMDELPARTYLPPDGTLPKFTWKPGIFDSRKESYNLAEMQKLLSTEQGLKGPGPGLPYDVDRARKLLAEAGYPNGAGFPRLPILYNTNSTIRRQYSQMLKDQWKRALNIDVDIQGLEGKIFSRNVSAKDYWIGTAAWYGDYAEISTFTDKYKSASLQNDSAWESKVYDELCEKAESEPDEQKRIDLLSQAEHMIDTEVPIIPLYRYVNISMFRDNVRGVRPNPRNLTIFKDISVERGGK